MTQRKEGFYKKTKMRLGIIVISVMLFAGCRDVSSRSNVSSENEDVKTENASTENTEESNSELLDELSSESIDNSDSKINNTDNFSPNVESDKNNEIDQEENSTTSDMSTPSPSPNESTNTSTNGNTESSAGNTTTTPPSGNNHDSESNNSSSGSSGNEENNNFNDSSSDDIPDIEIDIKPEVIKAESSKEAFDLINEERVKLGLKPAVWDEECEHIALLRAQELFELGYVNSSNAHAGIKKFKEQYPYIGECVAWGFMNAEGTVNGWMNSTGHRNVLMDEDRVKMAVARCGTKWVAINNLDLDTFFDNM